MGNATVQNIILAGFMGTGKSSVGRKLAERLGWTFIDTDEIIERRAGRTISEIFATDGEPAFRAMEAAIARELAGMRNHVVSTGGGMVVAEANLRALEAAGAVVLLEADAEAIYNRIKSQTHRPLLAKPDPRAEIERLLALRAEAYGRIAIKVATGGKDQQSIAHEILERLGLLSLPTRTVRVELGARSYPIFIGHGWIDSLGELLKPHFPLRPCTLVTNPDVGKLWAGPVRRSLALAGYRVDVCELPEGEAHKRLATVEMIYDHMLEARHSRQSAVIALGGGVIGDMAGFAAATLLRGIAFIQLPTTLLAMVDSSVGGKTGVDHPRGKNLIGAFWQPVFVGIDTAFLDTLPVEELRSGMAEVIKYGVIADAGLFAYLEEHVEAALARDPEVLAHLVTRSCQIKADVVGQDETESGLRAILNYGHTFGHAAEALCNYEGLRHGEAVAMGMVAAARLAERRALIGESDVKRLVALIERAGLPTRLAPFGAEKYWAAMGSDKKVKNGKIGFVLPEALGRVGIYHNVTREEIEGVIEGAGKV